jgi:hypothetical protein
MDTDVWPDNIKEAAVMIGLAVFAVSVIGLWHTNPGLIFRAEALLEQLTIGVIPGIGYSTSTADVTLQIETREVKQLNVNSRETTHEYAYCGVMSDPTTISNAWLTDTIEASQTQTTFSVDNCPFSAVTSYKSLIHYQPTSVRLSETDRKTALRYGYDYTCVMVDQVSENPGTVATNLKCYSVPTSTDGEFTQVDVMISSE